LRIEKGEFSSTRLFQENYYMPKVAPQLSRFKNKELRSRKSPEPADSGPKPAFVQRGKPVNFGPGWERTQEEAKKKRWKTNKTRTPRSPFMTQRGAKHLDERREASLARAEEQRAEQILAVEVEVPMVPVIEAEQSVLSKLADMAESGLGLVALGITGRFMRKKR
jgi:hypothetical protein